VQSVRKLCGNLREINTEDQAMVSNRDKPTPEMATTMDGDSKMTPLARAVRHILNGDPKIGVHQWLGIRKDAALKIDPATAEVTCHYGMIMDPYGVDPDLPDELWQIGRVYFARAPGSDVWVSFDDLPDEVCTALRNRNKPPRNSAG
jgi:hypothetical protein